MQHIFIINPTAGKVDASVALIPQIHAAASRAGVRPTIEVTRRAGQARDLAAKYASSAQEVFLYACGGDGTLNEVLQGAAGYDNAAVGCVPCGSGNDYVRNFGTQAQFLDLDAQLAARPFTVDMIRTPQASTPRWPTASPSGDGCRCAEAPRPTHCRSLRRCAAPSAIGCASRQMTGRWRMST